MTLTANRPVIWNTVTAARRSTVIQRPRPYVVRDSSFGAVREVIALSAEGYDELLAELDRPSPEMPRLRLLLLEPDPD